MKELMLLGAIGILLFSGCVQHPANRPGGEKYVFADKFCEDNNGIYRNDALSGRYCDVKQPDGTYISYYMRDISKDDYPEYILVRAEVKP